MANIGGKCLSHFLSEGEGNKGNNPFHFVENENGHLEISDWDSNRRPKTL